MENEDIHVVLFLENFNIFKCISNKPSICTKRKNAIWHSVVSPAIKFIVQKEQK
jgi:hypothetical protein